jgi:threonine synthase
MRKGLAVTARVDLSPSGGSSATPAPDWGPATGLTCRACGAGYPLGDAYACLDCFGPLEVSYDFGRVTHADLETGPTSMWRYAPLLPVPADVAQRRTLAPGLTRLVRADNLARALGMRTLWVKDDSGNPTHSFKDRVVAVALTAAQQLGFGTVGCASTGNLANAVAAAAAQAGLRSCVFVPSDLEAGKIVTTAVYGGTLVAVDGTYDDVNRLCSEVAGDLDWGFVNVNLRPYYAEGSKTLGYEICEQLGWRLPQQVVCPVASGSLLTKVDKAFGELVSLGLAEGPPARMFGAQAAGCSPVSQAFAAGLDVVRPVRPDTIAKSLAIGNPADGPYALDVARRTGGAVTDVTDAEIVAGIQLLATTEGIFGETAGGVAVAAVRRLLAEGRLDPDAETVVLNTGDGLKTLDAVVPVAQPSVTIPPRLGAFLGFAEQEGLA